MKGRYISMFVISVTLVYSAPTKNSTTLLNPTFTSNLTKGVKLGKPVLRSEIDNTPGKCCSDISKRCCPYDYDDECGDSENRTLCGYNKNQKKPEVAETTTIKYGLICWPKDDRLDCGYDRRFDDYEVISTVHNEEITTKTTLSSSTETTEAATTSMITEETKTITFSTMTAATEETETATFSTVTTATQPITEWTTATELPSSTVTTETTAFSTEGTTTTRVITKANEEFTSKSTINILPWKCCSSNILRIGGPYDYDENKCYIYGNRTLCGYNKNPSTPKSIETKSQFIKNGQNCEINGERFECGYGEGSAATDVMSTIPVIQDITVPITKATTVTTTESTESTETITVTTETTEITTDTTTTDTTTELSETKVMLLSGSLKPKRKTTRKKYRKLTTIECVKLHSKIACRAIPINEELDYA